MIYTEKAKCFGLSLALCHANLAIIQAAAARRQGHGVSDGGRSPVALGAGRVHLRRLSERAPDGRIEPVTPLGFRTAVRALPRVLSALEESDPRRQAATFLADAVERVGAVKGVDWSAGDTKGGQSDGGVTTKIKHAHRLRLIEAAANGWPIDQRHGSVVRGAPALAMEVRRRRGSISEIKAFDLVVAVCVEGHDLAKVLSDHGWSVHSKHTAALGAALLDVLDRVAYVMGGAVRPANNPVDANAGRT